MLSLMMTRSPGLTDDRAPNGAILSTSHKWSDMLYQNGLVGGYSKIASSEPGVVYPPVSCAILYVARTLGDAVELPDGYRFGWAYIPHFIHTRFYTYAYVFAHLASLALYARYREDSDAFVGPYLDFLSIGGAASPQEQLAGIGLDISRDDCWDAGFAEIERLIEMAEAIEPG